MKVARDSWHYKVRLALIGPIDQTSVCGYWFSIFVGGPFLCAAFLVVAPFILAFIPFAWVGEKIERKLILGDFCLFGKVEIVESSLSQRKERR